MIDSHAGKKSEGAAFFRQDMDEEYTDGMLLRSEYLPLQGLYLNSEKNINEPVT